MTVTVNAPGSRQVRRRIFELLAAGKSQREVAAAVGYKAGSHWGVSHVVREARRALKLGQSVESLLRELRITGTTQEQAVARYLRHLAAAHRRRFWTGKPQWIDCEGRAVVEGDL